MSALSAEALNFGHRDALNPDIRDGLTDVIELEWLDDRGNQLHCIAAPFSSARTLRYRRDFEQSCAPQRYCIFYATDSCPKMVRRFDGIQPDRTHLVRPFRRGASNRGTSA